MMETPVVFIIFNRPEVTSAVFEAIRAARPANLLVVADGPRHDRPGESERCAEARAVIDKVDWPCVVHRNYSDVNLGCKRRIVSGITWAFSLFSEVIVLEDDVVPDPTFFRFCQELLSRYRDDARVGMINGGNFLKKAFPQEDSYYFSRFGHVWGWACWRRVWELYDADVLLWPKQDPEWLTRHFGNKQVARYWSGVFDKVYRQQIGTWDYQMDFCLWTHGMCSIAPSVNLVSNLGFGAEATHTKGPSEWSAMTTKAMQFPLVHPEQVAICQGCDEIEYDNYLPVSWLQRKRQKTAKIFRALKGLFS